MVFSALPAAALGTRSSAPAAVVPGAPLPRAVPVVSVAAPPSGEIQDIITIQLQEFIVLYPPRLLSN